MVFVISAVMVAAAAFHSSAAPQLRTIEIVSIPAGAQVTVNGQPIGSPTPATYTNAVPGKTYQISVELSGYAPWNKKITIAADSGDVKKIIADLKRPSVTLRVSTTPPGARVLLNGKSLGRSPLLLDHLDPSAAKILTIRLRGYRPVSRTLDWSQSAEKDLSIDLKP